MIYVLSTRATFCFKVNHLGGRNFNIKHFYECLSNLLQKNMFSSNCYCWCCCFCYCCCCKCAFLSWNLFYNISHIIYNISQSFNLARPIKFYLHFSNIQPKSVTLDMWRAYYQADLYVNAKDIRESRVKPRFSS